MEKIESENWTIDVSPARGLLSVPIREIVHYRDLLFLFVKRDFVSFYKQTIFGPIWFIAQPVLTALMFTFVFGKIAGLSTDGTPQVLFYLSGVTIWGYFSDCVIKTAGTFNDNAALFGKVYFPRLIVPFSVVVSNLLKFGVQFGFLLVVWGIYLVKGSFQPQLTMLLLPILLVILSSLGLGLGLVLSSLTAKYRDLKFVLAFGVQLLMYLTPVIYPVSSIPDRYSLLVRLNPLAPVVEVFRHGLLGAGNFSVLGLSYSFGFSMLLLFIGVIVFNKSERSFIDTV